MSFKILGLVCLATSLVAGSRGSQDHHVERLDTPKHIYEANTFILPKRQEQPWRNATRSSLPPATTWTSDTVPLSSTPIPGQDHTTSALISSSVTSPVATPTPSSSHYSTVAQSSHTEGPTSAGSSGVSASKSSFASTSLQLQTSTFPHVASSSSSFNSIPSSVRATSAIEATSSISSTAILPTPSSTVATSSATFNSQQQTTSNVASTIPSKIISSQSSSISFSISTTLGSEQPTTPSITPTSTLTPAIPSQQTSNWVSISSVQSTSLAQTQVVPISVVSTSVLASLSGTSSAASTSSVAPSSVAPSSVAPSSLAPSSLTTPSPVLLTSFVNSVTGPYTSTSGTITITTTSVSAIQTTTIPITLTPTASGSAKSSSFAEAPSSSPSSTFTLVTYLSATPSSVASLVSSSSLFTVLSSTLPDTFSSTTISLSSNNPASSAFTGTPPHSNSDPVATSSLVQPTPGPLNTTILTPSAILQSTSSSYSNVIPTSESLSSVPQITQSSQPLPIDRTSSTVITSMVYGTGTTNTPSKAFESSSASLTWTSSSIPPSSLWPSETLNLSITTSAATLSSASIFSVSVSTISPISSLAINATSFATPALSTVSSSQWYNSVNLSSATIPALSVQVTSVVASESSAGVLTKSQGWNTTRIADPAEPTGSLSSVIVPTKFVSSTGSTESYVAKNSSAPDLGFATKTETLVGSTLSANATAAIAGLSTASSVLRASTVSPSIASNTGPTKFVTVTLSATTSATSTAIATPPVSPPLTVSQKAGVVIAGTTGFLIALVAAIYVARRYRSNKARRASTGSIYPKVAYLYDPPADGSDRDGDLEEALMSGAASGMPPLPAGTTSRATVTSNDNSDKDDTITLPMRFSDPGNPFRDPEDDAHNPANFTHNVARVPSDTLAALAAGVRGYRTASQDSTLDLPAMKQVEDKSWPAAPLDTYANRDARSVSRRSILSEIASMAYNNKTERSHRGTPLLQPPSPYGLHANRSLPCVRETTYTDSFRDPFEHDLPLKVDSRTETPDFVTVYAPSTESHLPPRTTPPVKVHSKNPWASSMLGPTPTGNSLADSDPISPDATIVASERFSLAYDNDLSTTYIAPSHKQVMSPISPLSGATHRGWEDIKRYSAEKVVPSTASLSPPLGYASPTLSKNKSLPQLPRREQPVAGQEEGSRLPLALKIPFAPRMSGSVVQDISRGDDRVRSPDSTFSHSVHSLASLLQSKRSRETDFTHAEV